MKVRWKDAPGLPSDEEAVCEVVWIVVQTAPQFGIGYRESVYTVVREAVEMVDPNLSNMVFFPRLLRDGTSVIADKALAENPNLILDMMAMTPGAYVSFLELRGVRP